MNIFNKKSNIIVPPDGFGGSEERSEERSEGKKECILLQNIDIRLYLDGLFYISDKFAPKLGQKASRSPRMITEDLMKTLANPKARKDLFVTFTQTVVCKEKDDFCKQKGGTEEPYEKPKFDKKTGKIIGEPHDVSRFSVAFKQYCRKCKVLGGCMKEGKEQCKCTFKFEDPTIMGEFRHGDIMNLLQDLIIKDNANWWQRKMMASTNYRIAGLGGTNIGSPLEAEVKKARKKLCDKITKMALATCPEVDPALCCISGGGSAFGNILDKKIASQYS